jgi:ABC-2 type transport system ATP-binding protein
MIQVSNLSKKFDSFCAINNISFSVQPGEVLGFLGPNGAGKSTTMKILTGFLAPSTGEISVMGHNVLQNPIAAQREIGYLPEGAPSYEDMTVMASLKFIGQARGFFGQELTQRIDSVVSKVELESVLLNRVETLSKGFRRRLGIAQALIHDPKVLILDEPTDGLDPNQKHQVRELIRNLSEDKTVIVSTHILEEVSAVCTRAMILAKGEIVFDGTPSELAAKSDFHNAVTIRLGKFSEVVVGALKKIPKVQKVSVSHDHVITVFSNGGQSILAEVNQVLQRGGCLLDELHVEVGRLDDVFRKVTLETNSADTTTQEQA